MITLDVSLVIAHLNPYDAHHQAATAYLRDSAGEPLCMHSLNLSEVLIGGVRAGRGQEMLSDLHALGVRVADRAEGEPPRLARLRVECGLKLPDCCALDTALATFDDALAQAARAQGVTVEPDPDSAIANPSR